MIRLARCFVGVAVFIGAACVCYAQEFRRALTFEDVHDATCRVCVSGARGTGWFAGAKDGFAFVFTNHHVVTSNQTARLDFWTNGRMESVQGKIILRAYDADLPADFACIQVDASELKKIDPPFLPIGGVDAKPSPGAVIVSSGAPDGRFTQCWKGQVLEYYNGKTAIFSPPPVPGQSGSPICEYVDGELFATGILTWLIGEKGRDDSKGGAIPIMNLYRFLKHSNAGSSEVDYEDHESPIPPDATECSETVASAPCVVMLSQKDCPPCLEAKKDVDALREKLVPVYVYDVESDYGAELAARFRADRTPTFFVLDSKYSPVGRFVGAGLANQILASFNATVADACPIAPESSVSRASSNIAEADNGATDESATVDEPLPGGAPDTSAPLDATLPSALPPSSSPSTSGFSANLPGGAPLFDFRNRPPVFDVTENVGFLEDSNDRWLNRGKKSPAEPETKDKPRLGERLADSAVDSIVSRVSKAVDTKVADMKEKAIAAWEASRLALLVNFVALVCLGALLAHIVWGALVWALKKTTAFLRDFGAFLLDKNSDPGDKA